MSKSWEWYTIKKKPQTFKLKYEHIFLEIGLGEKKIKELIMNEKIIFSIMKCFTSIRIYMLFTFHHVLYLVYRYRVSFKIF